MQYVLKLILWLVFLKKENTYPSYGEMNFIMFSSKTKRELFEFCILTLWFYSFSLEASCFSRLHGSESSVVEIV